MKRFTNFVLPLFLTAVFFSANNTSPSFGQWGKVFPNHAVLTGEDGEDIEEPHDYSPDDPQLGELMKQKNKSQWIINKNYQEANKKSEKEAQNIQAKQVEIHKYLLDSHLKELQSLKPKQTPDGKKAGLDLFNFPELDGSTNCINLGAIVTSYILGVPYKWELKTRERHSYNNTYPPFFRTYPPLPNTNPHNNYNRNNDEFPGVEWKVVADTEKVTFRQRNIFRLHYGQFQGTHAAYLSLIGKAKKEDNNEQIHRSAYGSQTDENGNYPKNDPTITPDDRGRLAFPQSEILLIARRPSEDEKKAMKRAEVELDIRPVALDGFVFILNRQNPVESLTLEQIQSIYASPQPKSWKDYGGNEKQGQINVYERNRNSGSRELMDELVVTPEALQKYTVPTNSSVITLPDNTGELIVGNSYPTATVVPSNTTVVPNTLTPSSFVTIDDKVVTPNATVVLPNNTKSVLPPLSLTESQAITPLPHVKRTRGNEDFRSQRTVAGMSGGGMSMVFYNLKQDQNAIAYSVYHYEHSMLRVPETRVLAVNGVFPNYENIRTKKYPLVYEIYVVTRKGIPDNSPAAKLRDWLLSDDGQRAVRESGYVPINPAIATE
ncbi:MAG: substrate-binding domain-containing protein [Planctomycetaceae bacterium]|jgi:ABC-type phosphate transport system substrate-binding protein|nr:substrate-binding domain-containing protein [Planctomycetaceae bacterium]